MAYRCAAVTGNFGTAATWFQGTNTPTQHASTNTGVTSAGRLTATFTAPNITNAVTGVHVYITNKTVSGSPTTFTATLQEATVDTACTKTITLANVKTGWNFIKMPTPYVFTAVTAGRYRWKFTVDTGTVNIAADSGGSLGSYISWDDRAVVPVSTDFVFINGENDITPITVTMDGTRACGNSNSYVASSRSILAGVFIGNGGILDFDTTASTQLTVQGTVYVADGGQYSKGSVATPLSNSYTSSTIYTMAAIGQGGLYAEDGAKVILQGAPQSSTSLWKTKLVSGVGTAADPLITADAVDWNVGDEILFSPTSNNATNYNETESRFIITKNSSTSYVLSATSGGGEAAFTYAHSTDAWCVNVKRNIIEKGTTTSVLANFLFNAQTATGNVEIKWVRFENIDNSLFFGVVPIGYVNVGNNCNLDYSVAYYAPNSGFYFTGSTANTHTGNVVYSTGSPNIGTNVASSGGFIATTAQQKNFVDCFVMQHGANGFCGTASYANTYTRCYAFSCHSGGTITATAGGFNMTGGSVTLTECEAHACRSYGVAANGASDFTYSECLFGTKGQNQAIDVYCVPSTAATILFNRCSFGSATLISGFANLLLGSLIRFHKVDDTDNEHRWYTPDGSNFSEDTEVATPSSLSVRTLPITTSGTKHVIPFPVNVGETISVFGKFWCNATFEADGSSTLTAELYLPGSVTPDQTVTMTKTTDPDSNDAVFRLGLINTSTVKDIATLRLVAKSTASGAEAYYDDINGGTNSISSLDIWYQGQPAAFRLNPQTLGDSAAAAVAVWNYLKSNMTVAGTAGKTLVDAADSAELASIK